jgi:hypothetical protein
MKKLICLMFFLFSASLVFSQNRVDTTLFIEPVSGGSQADRSFFESNLKMEISAAGYTIIDDILDAIYSISASIAPEDEGFVVSITLSNVEESREMVTQELFYTKVEESYEVLPFLIWQMLANAPFLVSTPPEPPPQVYHTESTTNSGKMAPIVNLVNVVPDDDSWKNKWIYLGAKFGVSPRFYTATGDTANTESITIDLGFESSIHAANFLSVQLEVDFSLDIVDYQNSPSDHVTYRSPILTFPLLLKGVLKPGESFLVEPYGGVYLNLPTTAKIQPPFGGASVGVDVGVKTGKGIIFFDFRYSTDFGSTKVDDGRAEFNRNIVSVTAGYKIGFLNRKQSASRFRGVRY